MNIRNKEFVCGWRLRAKLAKRAGFKSLEFKVTGHPVLKTYRYSCKLLDFLSRPFCVDLNFL